VFGMRTLILGIAAASLLASGIAFSLQVTRAPSGPLEATRKPSESAAAPAPVAASETTPIEFRQVRSVPILDPGAGRPNAPAAAPAETPRTASFEVEPAPRAGADQDRPADIAQAEAHEATSTRRTVASLSQNQNDVAASAAERRAEASIERPLFTKPSHTRKRSSASAKPSRRSRHRAEIAATQAPPPGPPAYDGRNENHSPFSSLRQLFSGAQTP
jgi:hypothetical protein